MIHQNLNISKEERDFNDFISHGDDFMKIQIYRNAREMYTQALNCNFNNNLAVSKLTECNMLIKSESRTIILIVCIMAIIATIIAII